VSFPQAQRSFIVEHYIQSQPYLKYQDDISSAFPKYQVPDMSAVFRSVTQLRETGSDRKCSGRPTMLNDVSVENIQHSLVTSPRKFSIY
jgi:hypothetical protein